MLDRCLIFFLSGGGLSEPVEDCLKFSVGAVFPVLFGTPGTREFGSEIPVDPLLTHMSI